MAKVEGKIIDEAGKVRKTTAGSRKTLDGGFVLWTGSWELFDLPAGVYTVEMTALDKEGKVVTSRTREGAAWQPDAEEVKAVPYKPPDSTSGPAERQSNAKQGILAGFCGFEGLS